MANINIVVDSPISDGSKLKFRTPCDSTVIEGLEVKYPAKNGVGTLIKKFVFKDAHGTELSGVGNLFVSGVMIEVLLDVTHGVAYIKNADTNSYVEGFKTELQRLEESQKQFLAVAGNAVTRCENIANAADGFENAMANATERAESVKGVYVGSGDMPDGYAVQIDPNGETFDPNIVCDYVVEQGTDGIWTYRKWASGVAECCFAEAFNITRLLTLGDSHFYFPVGQYPFPDGLFIDVPVVNADIAQGAGDDGLGVGQGIFFVSRGLPEKEHTGNIYANSYRFALVDGMYTQETIHHQTYSETKYEMKDGRKIPCVVNIEAKGRWKE